MMKCPLVGLCLLCNKSDRQTYERSSRKKVRIHPVTFAGIHAMIIEIVVKKPIVSPKMLDKVLFWKGGREDIAQIVTSLTQVCPCAWCEQPGHIAQDCMAHFADNSMWPRFPKREKTKKTPIEYYECRCCGGSHPFNIYCPNVRDPPVIPGECRSCGPTTRELANDCQYVTIKDNIGLCTYCQAQDHRYAACPQWAVDQEMAT